MKDVQLDKNSDAKRLARSCNEQGLVACFRLPANLRDELDDAILRYAKVQDRLLVIYDRPIAEEFAHVISERFPGIVIIAMDDDGPFVRGMTRENSMRILARFKTDFPSWHAVSWDNSVVQIQPRFITVSHVDGGHLVRTGFLDRRSENWQTELLGLLNANATK